MSKIVKFLLFVALAGLVSIIGSAVVSWVTLVLFIAVTGLSYFCTSMATVAKRELPITTTGNNNVVKLSVILLMLIAGLLAHYTDDVTTAFCGVGALCGILLAVEGR